MRLFVYGTLKGGSRYPLARVLQERGRLLGAARLPGRLYRRGWYPVAVHDPGERQGIEGELWELPDDPRLLAELDRYEGCGKGQRGGEFVRREVTVETPRGAVQAWAWVARREPRALPRIRSGVFRGISDARPARRRAAPGRAGARAAPAGARRTGGRER